jgi:hypothetical protein
MYHLLGIDAEMIIRDAQGRPYPLSTGEPVWELL